jgi:hypothetical protein
MRSIPSVLLATAIVLTLAACDPAAPGTSPSPTSSDSATPTPTPTPTPTAPPTLDELELSADGMGTLVFGEAPSTAPASQMIAEDPGACSEFYPAGTPEATRWRPIAAYLAADQTFGVSVSGGVLERIDLFGSAIPTDAGIRVGDAAADLATAYPSATVSTTDLTDIFVVTGTHGTLQIEVARDHGFEYWQASDLDKVVYIHATVTGYGTFTVAASENIAGGCL